MAKKHVDPLKAKQKKQKIVAGVLGVAFLGLLAFQVPRVMKQLNPPAPPVASSTSTTAIPPGAVPTLAAPTLRGAAAGLTSTTTGPGTGSLASADLGVLASFGRFASKDPFAQQLAVTAGSPAASPAGGGKTTNPTVPAIPGNAPAPGSAVISVNGVLYTVAVGSDFPQSSTDTTLVPIFHLVSLTAHGAKISIVGGSYSNGAGAVTLKENKPVTLMNTADGTRYRVVLKPQGTSTPAPTATGAATAGTATTPATVTLPPATP
ncbi:MAG: hypothetical protein M3R37_02035 [Actinomycetota bacterium]|nr:hypothetical protein [Actinomycetota bacterium]